MTSASTAATTATTPDTAARLERRLERARAENRILEQMIEDKTRSLYLANEEVRATNARLEVTLASIYSAVFTTDLAGTITSIGGTTARLTGFGPDQLTGSPLSSVLHIDPAASGPDGLRLLSGQTFESKLVGIGGDTVPVLVTVARFDGDSRERDGLVFAATDISERQRLELELIQAQRLEALGEVAAGVAHEINTPIQFVADSVTFLADAIDDLLILEQDYRPLRELATGCDRCRREGAELLAQLEHREDEADRAFLREEIPAALNRSVEGLERVSSIVKAMKQFSHPGDDLTPTDVNQIVEYSLTVARNEYKHVAELHKDLGPLPEVMCNRSDLGQVIVNLVVNAAHAIGDQVASGGGMGRITVKTRADGDGVRIDIGDTGGGIPPEIRDHIFEPFFTTKEPGRGTGQGLALVHNMVMNRNKGRVSYDVDDGVGTTFHVWLPRKRVE